MVATGIAQQHDILVVGILSFVGVLATAMVTWSRLRFNRSAVREVAGDLLSEMQQLLDTGNGHTAGQALARLEAQVTSNIDRLDRMEVIAAETQQSLAKHIVDVAAQAEDYATNIKPVVDRLRAEQKASPGHPRQGQPKGRG